MERFTVAMIKQLQVIASSKRACVRLLDFENLHHVFGTLEKAESTDKSLQVGSKIKITRLLPTGHHFLATYSVIRHEEDKMEIQFYSDDIVSPGTATVSTTWAVEPMDDNSCMVITSIAVVPHKFFFAAGRVVFAPFLNKLVKRTIKQDLKDLAASFVNEKAIPVSNSIVIKEQSQSSSSSYKPPRRPSKQTRRLLAHAGKFEEADATENSSERTRTTCVSYDDVASTVSYASRATPLGRLGYPEELPVKNNRTNIREVRTDGRIR